jgi:serine/threonine-protein kinase
MSKLSEIPEGTIINNQYKIVQLIGIGGQACVYKAIDGRATSETDTGPSTGAGQFVAIKISERLDNSDSKIKDEQRLKEEARKLYNLNHKNIVALKNYFVIENMTYIVTDFLEGTTLKQRIKDKDLKNDQILNIIIQMLSVQEYLHSHNIVHRDIKPSNIMIDENHNATLIDFGVSKGNTDIDLTETGKMVGTAYYNAPEILRGGNENWSSDLYSLGVTAFECFEGKKLYDSSIKEEMQRQFAIAHMHISNKIPTMGNHVPKEVQKLIYTMLEKNPVNRFPSLEEAKNSFIEVNNKLYNNMENLRYSGEFYFDPEINDFVSTAGINTESALGPSTGTGQEEIGETVAFQKKKPKQLSPKAKEKLFTVVGLAAITLTIVLIILLIVIWNNIFV